jgi:hypothetical protein
MRITRCAGFSSVFSICSRAAYYAFQAVPTVGSFALVDAIKKVITHVVYFGHAILCSLGNPVSMSSRSRMIHD